MAEKGVNVPFGIPATTVEEAVAAGATIGDEEVVIKSQILAGCRGLGTFTNGLKGGVHVIKTSEIGEYAGKMLGGTLVTKQSGPEGKPVNTLLLAKKMSLVRAPPPPAACAPATGRPASPTAMPRSATVGSTRPEG